MGLSACRGQHDGLTLLRVGRYASALIVLQPAATAGNAQAQNALAIQYYLGLGTPRDLAAARRWFELAALQGNAAAQTSLGAIYLNGYGVERDFERAYGWFSAAASTGNPRALAYIGVLTDKLTPNQMRQVRSVMAERLAQRSLP